MPTFLHFVLSFISDKTTFSYCSLFGSQATCAPKIRLFRELQTQFERPFLLGDYTTAECVLDTIETECGRSFWSLEKRFLTKEWNIGLAANAALLAEISDMKGIRGLTPYMATYFSLRAERNSSAENYQLQLDKAFSQLLEAGAELSLIDQLRLYLIPWHNEELNPDFPDSLHKLQLCRYAEPA